MDMIDTPSPFASLNEWKEYLAMLKKLSNVDELIAEAEKMIADKETAHD